MKEYNDYCQKWIDKVNELNDWNVSLIVSPYFPFEIGEIVSFTFNDTIAHIKGFYNDPISGYSSILGGLDNETYLSMCLTNLRKANDVEKKTFSLFSDVEAN